MENLLERAKMYARHFGARIPEVCAFHYIVGAKEERALVYERVETWLANMVCEGLLETSNLPRAITRFKEDFK